MSSPNSNGEAPACQSSRPSTSHSCNSSPTFARQGGVQTNPAQTYQKLGFVSPSYNDGQTRGHTSHGIIGGVGYTSSLHKTLIPALQQKLRDPARQGPHRQVQSCGSHRPPRQQLSKQDLEYLRDNAERNRQVFEAWRQAKDEEIAVKSANAERQRVQDFNRFLHKEVQLRHEAAARVSEWQQRKATRAQLEAQQRRFYGQLGRQAVVSTNIRNAEVQVINRQREDRFLLKTDPHVLPTRFGFYTTLGQGQEITYGP